MWTNSNAYVRLCINSIFAGIMISIGAVVYLNCPNKIVGSFLFSIGLITIMSLKFNLYTGEVRRVRKAKDIPAIILIFIMNAIGCSFTMLVPIQINNAIKIMESKLLCPIPYVFVKAIICGILIFICVHLKDNIVTILAISSFILGGAEHSIADICFMFASKSVSFQAVLFILIVAIGNAVGSLLMSLWVEKRNELHKNY